LFDQVVRASRMHAMLAPFTVRRLLIRADVNPRRLDIEGVRRALPTLETGLASFLDDVELSAAVAEIRQIAGLSS